MYLIINKVNIKIDNILKEEQKKICTAYLDSINKQLYIARNGNDSRIPYGLVKTIIQSSKATIPWLIRSIINKSFKKFIVKRYFEI